MFQYDLPETRKIHALKSVIDGRLGKWISANGLPYEISAVRTQITPASHPTHPDFCTLQNYSTLCGCYITKDTLPLRDTCLPCLRRMFLHSLLENPAYFPLCKDTTFRPGPHRFPVSEVDALTPLLDETFLIFPVLTNCVARGEFKNWDMVYRRGDEIVFNRRWAPCVCIAKGIVKSKSHPARDGVREWCRSCKYNIVVNNLISYTDPDFVFP